MDNDVYEVEFWPGKTHVIDNAKREQHMRVYDEEEALLAAIDDHRERGPGGWPGGCEAMAGGTRFVVHVRKRSGAIDNKQPATVGDVLRNAVARSVSPGVGKTAVVYRGEGGDHEGVVADGDDDDVHGWPV